MSPRPSIFQSAAGMYDFLTHQPYWLDHAANLLGYAGVLPRAPRLLELGCGPGRSTRAMIRTLDDGALGVGLDVAPRMVARANRLAQEQLPSGSSVGFVLGDAHRLPFADSSFHLVAGHSFLYLVHDRPAVLREALRVLVPGGMLLLMEPNAEGSLLRAARRALPAAPRAALHGPASSARFALAMVVWRAYTLKTGRLASQTLLQLLNGAGFQEVTVQETLGGLGLLCSGRRQ